MGMHPENSADGGEDAFLQALLALLQERIRIVGDREHYARDPQDHLRLLTAKSEELDALTASLHGKVDPMLQHYMERQSYLKAIDWLQNHLSRS